MIVIFVPRLEEFGKDFYCRSFVFIMLGSYGKIVCVYCDPRFNKIRETENKKYFCKRTEAYRVNKKTIKY